MTLAPARRSRGLRFARGLPTSVALAVVRLLDLEPGERAPAFLGCRLVLRHARPARPASFAVGDAGRQCSAAAAPSSDKRQSPWRGLCLAPSIGRPLSSCHYPTHQGPTLVTP